MLRLIAFVALSIFATYMEYSLSNKRGIGKTKVIPVSNQLPA